MSYSSFLRGSGGGEHQEAQPPGEQVLGGAHWGKNKIFPIVAERALVKKAS